jgi:hypothetical protein
MPPFPGLTPATNADTLLPAHDYSAQQGRKTSPMSATVSVDPLVADCLRALGYGLEDEPL